ncbi:hypothetical protein [Bacteroides thetaiotaomicron]|nr:hypothetical protein [Bacteroides thetaiotaomicron]
MELVKSPHACSRQGTFVKNPAYKGSSDEYDFISVIEKTTVSVS